MELIDTIYTAFSAMLTLILGTYAVLVLIVLVFGLLMTNTMRYRLKFIVIGVASGLFVSISIPFMFRRIRDWRNALFPAWLIVFVVKWMGVTYRLRGLENIVKDNGSVVLLNHQSSLDLIVLAKLWPLMDNSTVISKRDILYFGPFGIASWLWGTVFINRRNVKEAQEIIKNTAKYIKESKMKLLMFPEGKRHSGNTLMPFKKGAFHSAISSQAPIQPVVVSKYYFLSTKPKRFDSGTSYISILPPIPTAGLTTDDLPQLVEKTYKIMNDAFQELNKEACDEYMKELKGE